MSGAALAFATAAHAVAPAITSVGQDKRHAKLTFSAPRASSVEVYIARKPDRATDGKFLQENIEEWDFLTDSEIQAGVWMDDGQLDPGTYYVMIEATPSFDLCYSYPPPNYNEVVNNACARGFSSVVTLTVPKPAQRWKASARVYRYSGVIELTLSVSPLGERLPYRVCYRTKAKKQRCLNDAVSGYSWNSSASDSVTVKTRGLAKRTNFTWYAYGRKLGSLSVRVS